MLLGFGIQVNACLPCGLLDFWAGLFVVIIVCYGKGDKQDNAKQGTGF
jgi:hypothetical protein